jgi:hypothetical protein
VTLPLRVALDQCLRHARLMSGALADLPETFDAHAVTGDNGPLIRTIDPFVLRFIKLQDTLGEHVLRAFASEVLAGSHGVTSSCLRAHAAEPAYTRRGHSNRGPWQGAAAA